MLNIVLFGPPGAGKGTQAALIKEKYHLTHLSTGDILREEMANKTEAGEKAKQYMANGELVPDSLVVEQLYKRTVQVMDGPGVMFDGFPRTIPQAGMLDDILAQSNLGVSIVIGIEVEDQELVTRLLGRAKDSGRVDDTQEIIENRLKVYKAQTLPLVDHYTQKGLYVSIKGVGTVQEVFAKISAAIDKVNQ